MDGNLDSRIRVLTICYEDPEVLIGGMGRHVGENFKAMAKRDDVEIDMLTTGPGEARMHDGYMKYYTDKLVAYKPRQSGVIANLCVDIQGLRTIMRLMAQGKRWDVVHIHDWNCVQLGRAVRDALDIPMVSTMHLCLTYLMEHGGVYERGVEEDELYTMQMEGHLVADADQLILCSDSFVGTVSKTFMLDREINMIYNGIDLERWNPNIETELLPAIRPIALYVGRIADMKGIRVLLDAVEMEDTGYKILLVGDVNADTDEIKENWDVTKRIRALEERYPERLHWAGFANDESLRALYKHATVGIMPSVHEPFGIVALEFMAMGVPLICTEVGGLGEIVKDDNGEYAFIIPPEPKAINDALRVCRSEAVRRELKYLGLERAQDFDWDDVAMRTMDVYRRAINDRINRRNHSKELDPAQGAGRQV